MKQHIFSVWVENQAGVVSRVAALFGEAGLNIDGLAAGLTEKPGVSRITLVAAGTESMVGSIVDRMNHLGSVIQVRLIAEREAVARELVLFKVDVLEEQRAALLSLVDIFKAQIVDVWHQSVIIEASGDPDKLQALEDLLRVYGIQEMVRTGLVALERGRRSKH